MNAKPPKRAKSLFREGDVYAVTLRDGSFCVLKIAFKSKVTKLLTGAVVYCCITSLVMPRDEWFSTPRGTIYFADYSRTEVLDHRLTYLGTLTVNSNDVESCKYANCKKYYVGDQETATFSEYEKELLPSLSVSLGIDGIVWHSEMFCGLETMPIEQDADELRNSKSKLTRYYAARRLGARGPASRVAIKDLLQALTDEGKNVRRMASLALANIGTASAEVLGALRTTATDENPDVRAAANWAIERLVTSTTNPLH